MPTKQQLDRLKKDVAAHVAEGFSSRSDIIGRFTEDADEEMYCELYGEPAERIAEKLVDQAIAAHHRKQATWTEPTDCDKLDVTFKSLERQGVVARQRFT